MDDFQILSKLGEGAYSIVYKVMRKVDKKIYALKKSRIRLYENVKKRQEEIMMLKDFRKRTGSDGVISIFGYLCIKRRGYYSFFEIMELAEIDWEKEIENRGKYDYYYGEYELMEIMGQIIKTFSLLQKNHITHRDIKPQNIIIVKGKFKVIDFGNARILKKKEGLVMQRIRGSELYMAAALSYIPLDIIREIYDMNRIKNVIDHYLGDRYSQKVKKILISMLQVDEKT